MRLDFQADKSIYVEGSLDFGHDYLNVRTSDGPVYYDGNILLPRKGTTYRPLDKS